MKINFVLVLAIVLLSVIVTLVEPKGLAVILGYLLGAIVALIVSSIESKE